MSAPYSLIRSAFVSKLQNFTAIPPVAWENIPFTPPLEGPYLKPTLLPGEPEQATQGVDGVNRHPGLYQISIYAPSGSGLSELNTLRDALIDHFKRGTILEYEGISVVITKAFTGPTMQETDWQHVPITIQYRVDAAN